MNENISMVVKYWGVRGSVPAPLTPEQIKEKEEALVEKIIADGGTEKLFGNDPEMLKTYIKKYLRGLPLSLSGTYGGDTTCLEIQAKDSPLIILDAGTGIRNLGKELTKRLFSGSNLNPLNTDENTKKDIHLLFTHYHWDHIQGFPFFAPAFIPGDNKVKIHFYGKKDARKRLSEVLEGQQQYPNFPVVWEDMPCNKEYTELPRLEPHEIPIGKASVVYQELTHPDSVFAYSVEINGKKFVCATDTEHKDSPDPRLVKLVSGADILYYDSQYDPEGYLGDPKSLTGPLTKFDWGHSTYEWAIRNALAANVRTVVLGHHEPVRDDFKIKELEERASEFSYEQLKLPKNSGKDLKVIMAYQGMEQRL